MKRVELARLARIDGDDQVCVALLTVALLSPACLHSLCLDFAFTSITLFAYYLSLRLHTLLTLT